MRVLMLSHNMDGYRGFWRPFHLARALGDRGHEVTVIASRRRPGQDRREEVRDGVRVVQMADSLPRRVRQGGLSPQDVMLRMAHVRRERYDVIHGFDHRPAASLPALLARRWYGTPYVADWADLWGRQGIGAGRRGAERLLAAADDWAEREAHRRADAVTAISTFLCERALALGVPADRVRLVGVGSNDTIRPLPRREMRARHGLPDDARVLVHAGFSEYDSRLLAETFVLLARREPRVLLVLCGVRSAEVDAIVREAGLSARVRHFGALPHSILGEVLAGGDVMMLPYREMGANVGRFPQRLGDYLAAGRPVATNPTGDVGPLVRDEGVGVVAKDDPASFAAAIGELLEDETGREEMGRRARHLAETRFTWRAAAAGLPELYERVRQTPARQADRRPGA